MFDKDVIIQPKQSAHFAQFVGSNENLVPLQKTEMWEKDLIGLRELDAKGKLYLWTSPDHHDQVTNEERAKVSPPLNTEFNSYARETMWL